MPSPGNKTGIDFTESDADLAFRARWQKVPFLTSIRLLKNYCARSSLPLFTLCGYGVTIQLR